MMRGSKFEVGEVPEVDEVAKVPKVGDVESEFIFVFFPFEWVMCKVGSD